MSGKQDTQTIWEKPKLIFQNLGIVRAKVTNNNDPYKIGRLRVRVISLHGDKGTSNYLKDDECPWATPCVAGGSFQDGGVSLLPIPGSWVWVFFEDNDTNKPVYIGGIPTAGSKTPRQMNNLNDPDSPQTAWYTNGTPEVPSDVFINKDTGVPERHVLYKSQKGHTIIMDDSDNNEQLSIIDRTGMEISFNGKVIIPNNPRELRRSSTNNMIDDQFTNDPHIQIKVGQSEDYKHETDIKIHREKFTLSSTNTEKDDEFTDLLLNESILKINNKKAEIFFDKEKINLTLDKENSTHNMLFSDSMYKIASFNKCLDIFTENEMTRTFGEGTISITEEEIKIGFENSFISIKSDGTINIKGTSILVEGENSSLELNSEKSAITGASIEFN